MRLQKDSKPENGKDCSENIQFLLREYAPGRGCIFMISGLTKLCKSVTFK